MIISKLKTICTTAGCTLVIYESKELANLLTDQSHQYDTIGLIIEPTTMTFEVKANAILKHYPPIIIEVLQQVRLEDLADNKETLLQDLLSVCEKIIYALIDAGEYKKLVPLTLTKILETRYDANCVGWSMPLELTYLLNENKC